MVGIFLDCRHHSWTPSRHIRDTRRACASKRSSFFNRPLKMQFAPNSRSKIAVRTIRIGWIAAAGKGHRNSSWHARCNFAPHEQTLSLQRHSLLQFDVFGELSLMYIDRTQHIASGPARFENRIEQSEDPLVKLGNELLSLGYQFTSVTPETYRRVNARPHNAVAKNLRDIFGWNRPFFADALPQTVLSLMKDADVLVHHGEFLKSAVRFSTYGTGIYLHSGYPTLDDDSVFFGPDSYRFVDLIRKHVRSASSHPRIVDVGCGSGIGGIIAARAFEHANLVLADINPRALMFTDINARIAGLSSYSCVKSDVFSAIEGEVDVVVSNPPYMCDDARRAYRHGGDNYGCDLSIRILGESIGQLAPGGQLILYTGTAVVEGQDLFRQAAERLLTVAGFDFQYEEIDPDVFGEELDLPAYSNVDRIAVVGLVAFAPTSELRSIF
jgi:SAM-dependent methyltransferase